MTATAPALSWLYSYGTSSLFSSREADKNFHSTRSIRPALLVGPRGQNSYHISAHTHTHHTMSNFVHTEGALVSSLVQANAAYQISCRRRLYVGIKEAKKQPAYTLPIISITQQHWRPRRRRFLFQAGGNLPLLLPRQHSFPLACFQAARVVRVSSAPAVHSTRHKRALI